MLRVTAYLFNLPTVDFTVSFSDNQCCDRPWLTYTTSADDTTCGAFLIPSYRLWQHVREQCRRFRVVCNLNPKTHTVCGQRHLLAIRAWYNV